MSVDAFDNEDEHVYANFNTIKREFPASLGSCQQDTIFKSSNFNSNSKNDSRNSNSLTKNSTFSDLYRFCTLESNSNSISSDKSSKNSNFPSKNNLSLPENLPKINDQDLIPDHLKNSINNCRIKVTRYDKYVRVKKLAGVRNYKERVRSLKRQRSNYPGRQMKRLDLGRV